MKLIGQKDGREVFISLLEQPYSFVNPFGGQEYVCFIFANLKIETQDRKRICEGIIESNCRYALCAGQDSDEWHIDIDLASVIKEELGLDTFLMTTSHEDESIDDMIWFGLNNTNYDYYDFKKFLVLFIGKENKAMDQVRQAVEKHL